MAGSDDSSRRRKPPPLPWTVRIQAAAFAFGHRLDGTIRRSLFFLGDLKKRATPRSNASHGVRSTDITIDASRGIWARVFSPTAVAGVSTPPLPVVVFFHGGGFTVFSAASRPYDALCRRLCRGVHAVVVSIDYRLAPEHRFPAAYDDGVAALQYLDANALPAHVAPVPVDLSSCFLAGDSSGGNMVYHVAQRWAASMSSSSAAEASHRRLRLAGAIMIQPFFGGEERTDAEVAFDKACRILTVARADWREFLPEDVTRDHPAARVCGDGVELADAFPPAMVVVGGVDLLRDWHARYVETLRRKGKEVTVVEYPDAFHGFYAFPELADSGKFVEDVRLFVDEHRSNKPCLGRVKGRERNDPPIQALVLMAEDAGVSSQKFEAPRTTEEEDDDSTFIVLDGEVWRTKKSKPKAPPKRMEAEKERRAVTEEEEEEAPELEMIGPDDEGHWMTVAQFRRYWNKRWSGYYGSFEDTNEPVEGNPRANGMDALQIYPVKLAAARGGLQLPLDVFGMVAIRDPLNPVIVEVDLKVKGTAESMDIYLKMAGGSDNSAAGHRKPSLPWTVRVQLAALGLAHRPDGSIRRLLFSLGDLKASASARPDAAGVRSGDVTIDASRGLWARVFSPSSSGDADAQPVPVVVYFHGGGFVLFSAASRPYDAFCRRICRELRAVVVSVNYRLAPDHRFPAAYDDGVATLEYLDTNALPADVVTVPIDLSSCFLAGDSAGGNIAHHVAQRWASVSAARVRVAGAVLIQPFFGGEERTDAEVELDRVSALSVAGTDHYWREFLPEGATRDHPAARVCGDGVELAEAFPPAMVVIGGFDLLKDWQARYAETLRGKGKQVRVVEYPDAVHGFHAFQELADAGKLVEEMKLFVQEHRSKRAV
ncbi:hypothetical protein HU200_045875 [Digitaria exilis]|uniref:Alpha/beta hydrolase fold-3 domain-containing protein n=1 Tax=Digitaria exilis TaxID=1010633 RepID=A0A835EF74_9POAL|nr:hypothetical protein HU200_045875 [Digitaria exilis]CAB3458781.1 unnamed protein product [Digitaria exilis]